MNRLYKLVACLLMLLMLAGCAATYYEPYEPPDPYPYSFSNPNKQAYPRTLTGARRFIEDATDDGDYDSYPHWYYVKENYYGQSPIFSERVRSGDCDDYAIMMGYYLQEYWGYDTFIVFLDMGYGQAVHVVCFVVKGVTNVTYCPNYPYLIASGVNYYPVDWTPCPGWTWASYGGTVDYLNMGPYGSYYIDVDTDRRVVFYTGQQIEWYEMVNLALDTDPERDDAPDPIPAEWSNDGR